MRVNNYILRVVKMAISSVYRGMEGEVISHQTSLIESEGARSSKL